MHEIWGFHSSVAEDSSDTVLLRGQLFPQQSCWRFKWYCVVERAVPKFQRTTVPLPSVSSSPSRTDLQTKRALYRPGDEGGQQPHTVVNPLYFIILPKNVLTYTIILREITWNMKGGTEADRCINVYTIHNIDPVCSSSSSSSVL